MIRTEALGWLWRWREVGFGLLLVLAGLWMVSGRGYLLVPVGGGVALLGLAFAVMAWRRLRFGQGDGGPGVVEVIEGQVGYLGPGGGGFVGLPDLVELRLLSLRGRKVWRLKQADGQALLIPIDAVGADALFDAFASLPGLDTGALVASTEPAPPAGGTALAVVGENRVIWRRRGPGVVAR